MIISLVQPKNTEQTQADDGNNTPLPRESRATTTVVCVPEGRIYAGAPVFRCYEQRKTMQTQFYFIVKLHR